MKILILTDYLYRFYSSVKKCKSNCTMETEKIVTYLSGMGYTAEMLCFSDLDYRIDYSGIFVLYQSAEDYDLKYRSYIEDIMLFLKEKGAILIPVFPFLRAHHNKSFMEMLRYKLLPEQANILNTRIYGTYEELCKADLPEQKYVIKSAYGAGSKYVKCAKGKEDLLKIAKKMSLTISIRDWFAEFRRRLLWKEYKKSSLNRNKLIVQDFIDNLNGDFKILKYGKRFYALYRQNREGDFRASGSGNLSFELPDDVNRNELFDFANTISTKLGTPLCSLDIAWDGKKFVLIEFQCLCFGPYTAEYSDAYFELNNDGWVKVDEKCDLELILAEAVDRYISGYLNE